ncbi:MAG: hypothetical protein ACKVIN_11690, partial [Longimicrobiales bacterium]
MRRSLNERGSALFVRDAAGVEHNVGGVSRLAHG